MLLSKIHGVILCLLLTLLSVGTKLPVLAADKPHVVILQGEPEYGSERTMPAFARELEQHLGVRTTVLRSDEAERGHLPDLAPLDEADLLVLFLRFRMASDTQFARLRQWFDEGRPAIAFRTTSHAFWEDKGWFVPFFGGHYKAHAPNQEGTSLLVPQSMRQHPVLRGVPASFSVAYGGTYNAQPLSDFVTPLLLGKTGDIPAEPVAWIAEYRPQQRLFYTSLGAEENFKSLPFKNLILNAAGWALNVKIPHGGVLERGDANDGVADTARLPAPAKTIVKGETLLPPGDLSHWSHWDPSMEPRAIGLDERADTTIGGPEYSEARWQWQGNSIAARPGFGDIVTKSNFSDGVFYVDFMIPPDTADIPQELRGNSGVFIDGKWEIQIIDSYGANETDDRYTCGAIFGVAAPMVNACRKPGEWQSMEITVEHTSSGANLSVLLNGVQIHDKVAVSEPTLYGFGAAGGEDDEEGEGERVNFVVFDAEHSAKANLGGDFALSLEIRTEEDGPVLGKSNPWGAFGKQDKALHVANGRVVFQLGSVGKITSRQRVDDGRWHRVELESSKGRWNLAVDRKRRSLKGRHRVPDRKGTRLSLGRVAQDYPEPGVTVTPEGPFVDKLVFRGGSGSTKPLLHWERKRGLEILNEQQSRILNLGDDFTALVRFRGEGDGPLFAKAPLEGEWAPNGKVLFIEDGQLVFDVGWSGALHASDVEVDDNQWHVAAVTQSDETLRLYVDGKLVDQSSELARPDEAEHVFKVGTCSTDFPESSPEMYQGEVSHVGFLKESLAGNEISELKIGRKSARDWAFWKAYEQEKPGYKLVSVFLPDEENEDEDEHELLSEPKEGPLRLQADSTAVRFANIAYEPLGDIDHAGIIQSWNEETVVKGKRVYDAICITCHGNLEKEGSLPTSRKFWEAAFKNGSDPYSLFNTLGNGFEQMPAFPFLTVQQRYDVIHYIRESLVKPTNRTQYYDVTDSYLASLPKGTSLTGTMTEEMQEYAKGPQYLRMNFGPMLDWTYQVAPNNIAYKAIAVRLDSGPGGVSKGRAWQLYDHDTMRLAAAWSGKEFIDWKGIAFDQSHGTHASIVGDVAFVNPVGPGWAHPETGSWEDPRFLGRDGKPYGPLPRDWVKFKGQYLHGDRVVIYYSVGDAEVLELAGMELSDSNVLFTRTFNIGKSSRDLTVRLAPVSAETALVGGGAGVLSRQDGFHVLTIPASATPYSAKVLVGNVSVDKINFQALVSAPPEDLSSLLLGGPPRFPELVRTQVKNAGNEAPFEVDEMTYPADNPWNSWMRIGGFDFMPDGKRAAVATWLGDVWIVDGIDSKLGELQWKRICTGLFQPLGVKVVDGVIYVTCRDQIAKLHDYNGDAEVDFIECFNSDHQVTEHFHEFAMGLQTDDEGNFYYAKSARHAKPALVPHHGTLLKVTPDGASTEILAVGFRAANGVCLNPDGSFIVTDQEGHWNPKNRINYVRKGGFYGNMMGYHNVVDESDEAMEQPLCWITNAFDRSPGELLWVPEWAKWGPLNGQLLNMSYGTGQVFLVPHEIVNGQAQGGMVSLGLEFPTGTMRGRFHPTNGQLYSTGMFAWAGNRHQDGGFYRIRYTGKPAYQITHLRAMREGIEVSFSDALDSVTAVDAGNYAIKIWGLKRTKNYGSRHYNERTLTVENVSLSPDRRRVFLRIPEIEPTWGMEIKVDVRGAGGEEVQRTIHNTIHHLQDSTIF